MAKQTFTTGQVLTAAQMTSLQQTAMLGGAASAKTASYTLVAADAGTALSMSNASATTITVNTALFAAGDTVQITNLGVGVCTITAGTATVNTASSLALAQYESGTLDFTSTSAAIFIKGAGAAPAGGGMTLLSTTTLSGSSTAISSISQSYKSLYVVFKNVYASTDTELRLRLNGDTGSNHFSLAARSDTNTYTGTANESSFNYISYLGDSDSYYYAKAFGVFQIDRYTETETHGFFSTGFGGQSGTAKTTRTGCQYNSTTAISSLTFLPATGTFSGGTVYVYGVN